MSCDIYVINLASSLDRKKNIQAQLTKLGLQPHFFSAINGHTEQHPLFSMYDDQLSKKYREKSLSKGQIGCYASHYLMWQKCVDLDHPLIIIEDDALIHSEPFLEFIEKTSTLDKKYECIRLFSNKRKNYCSEVEQQLSSTSICKFNKGHMSATGYFLTPNGAKKLLQHSQRWYMAVDIYMDRFWVNKVECFGTIPACLTNDPIFDSDIGYGKKPPRKLFARLKREWFSVKELLRRETHNFKYKMNHKVK